MTASFTSALSAGSSKMLSKMQMLPSVGSIVSAFCRLGYRIVAEGVETQEEMELLRSWNVDMIQGYYFSRPLPPDDLLRLLTGSAEMQAENQA